MSKIKPNNPFAFPVPASKSENQRGSGYNVTEGQEGMTLRDYFASKAMNGFASNNEWAKNSGPNDWDDYIGRMTRSAYQIADAMLAEREKQ